MCSSWAQTISDFAIAQGFTSPAENLQSAIGGTEGQLNQINKTILKSLPRGRKVPPLLTDWLELQLFNIDGILAVQTLPVGKRVPDCATAFPQGSKLVRFSNEMGVAVEPKPQQCFGR